MFLNRGFTSAEKVLLLVLYASNVLDSLLCFVVCFFLNLCQLTEVCTDDWRVPFEEKKNHVVCQYFILF